MRKKFIYSLFCFIACVVSVGIFMHTHELIIIYSRPKNSSTESISGSCGTMSKKIVTCFFYVQNTWVQEDAHTLIDQNSQEQIVTALVTQWLVLAHENNFLEHPVFLESVLITPAGQAYLSFTDYLWRQEVSTFTKIMIIESLLNTIRTYLSSDGQVISQKNQKVRSISSVYFLKHHVLCTDFYLDFEQPWALSSD